jgi:hypothetical protein
LRGGWRAKGPALVADERATLDQLDEEAKALLHRRPMWRLSAAVRLKHRRRCDSVGDRILGDPGSARA